METKRIGNIGEILTQSKFVQRGIPIYIPFGENEKADLIAEFNGKLNKIQIKTSERLINNKIIWRLSSRTVNKCHKYTSDEVDYFALYNLETGIHLLIPFKDLDGRASLYITIPYKPSKNQYKDFNWEDYTFEKVLDIPK